MPSTLAGQLTTVSLILVITGTLIKAKLAYDRDKLEQSKKQAIKDAEDKQHREWVEELWLEYCRHTGVRVSDDLIKKHMRINGNINKTSEEKDRIYGPDRPKGQGSSGMHKAASAGNESEE